MQIRSLILLIALAAPVFGQRTDYPLGNSKHKEGNQAQVAKEGARDDTDLDLIREFAVRTFAFDNPVWKVRTAAALAENLWPLDQSFSRDLLIKTYSYSKGLKPIERNATGSNADRVISATQIDRLRATVLSVVSRSDPKLAQRLANQSGRSPGDGEQSTVDRLAAETLLGAGDTTSSAKFAEQSIDDTLQPQIIDYLIDLRQQDERTANALFLRVLNRLADAPYVDRMTLLYLGYYPFRDSDRSPDRERLDLRSMIPIGGVAVWNISGDRSGASPEIVRAYLQAAAAVLSRGPSDAKQVKISYVAAYELMQNAQRWAPDLVPPFSATMQRLGADVPNVLTQPSTYDPLKPSKVREIEDVVTEIDAASDEAAHDKLCIWGVMAFVQYEKWKDAHKLAEKISAIDLRAKVMSLVSYSEARRRLKDGEIEFALGVAEKLPASVSRPLLRLEIARLQLKNIDKPGATDVLLSALKDARGVDSPQKPFLLLSVATELSHLDSVSAIQVFNEAAQLLDASPTIRCAWTEVLEVAGQPVAQYDLLEFDRVGRTDFVASIDRLYSQDPQGIVHTIMDLKDERLLGQAMTAIASTLIKNRPKTVVSRK